MLTTMNSVFSKIKENTDKIPAMITQHVHVPFRKTPIDYNQWIALHDKDDTLKSSKLKCFKNDALQLQMHDAILKGQVSRTNAIKLKPDSDTSASLTEILYDTLLTYTTPLEFLRVRVQEYMYDQQAILDCGSLHTNKTYARKVELRKKVLSSLIEELTMQINYITSFMASPEAQYFKPALRRAELEWRCMPTNLQLNRTVIESGDVSTYKEPSRYDTITFGVATDHWQKKSKCGLLKYVIDQKKQDLERSIESSDNVFDMDRFSKSMKVYFRMMKASQGLVHQRRLFENQIQRLPNQMENFLGVLQSVADVGKDDVLRDTMELFKPDCPQFAIWEKLQQELEQSISDFKSSETEEAYLKAHEVATSLTRMGVSALYLADVVKDELDYSSSADTSSSVTTDSDMANMIFSDSQAFDERRIASEVGYVVRRDIVLGQLLAAAALGIVTAVTTNWKNDRFWKQVESHGFLLQFESLISTWRAEQIMLEDHCVGVLTDLKKVKVQLCPSEKSELSVKFVGSILEPIIQIQFSAVEEEKTYSIFPVLFNVGINEEQKLADISRQTYPQDIINHESAHRIKQYCSSVFGDRYLTHSIAGDVLQLLEVCPKAPEEKKDVRIHEFAQKVAGQLHAVRFLQCKSAKDRTSMGVSLHQSRLLLNDHGLHPDMFKPTLDKIRKDGSGLIRCYKNVGREIYAFNSLQLATFPDLYKPPKGTYGSAMS